MSGWTSITSATSYSADVSFTLSSGDATKTSLCMVQGCGRELFYFNECYDCPSYRYPADSAVGKMGLHDQAEGPFITPLRRSVMTEPSMLQTEGLFLGETRGLYAINPDGMLKWSYLKGMSSVGDLASCPRLYGADGTIHAGRTSSLFAVNPDGTLKWSTTTIPRVSLGVGLPTPSVGSDGTIYVGADSIFFNPDGTLKWRSNIDCYGGSCTFRSGPAIAADGTIYIGGSGFFGDFPTNYGSTAVLAMNPDGTVKWQYFM